MANTSQPKEGEVLTNPDTAGYTFNHTMLRIKDPARSLPFYRDLLGMSLIRKLDFPAAKFSLYFLGHVDPADAPLPSDEAERSAWMFRQKGLVELTHNWGTETEPGEPYHDGNADPRGFGHLGLSVPDVDAACARFEAAGASFVKRPDEGAIKGIAFVRDPDGYWIEILPHRPIPGVS